MFLQTRFVSVAPSCSSVSVFCCWHLRADLISPGWALPLDSPWHPPASAGSFAVCRTLFPLSVDSDIVMNLNLNVSLELEGCFSPPVLRICC